VTTKILLVDDDESQRLTLGALFEDEGFVVDVAASFAEGMALLLAGAVHYDLVVLDQHLGDGLGSSLVPLVRARLPRAAVALVSGSVSDQERTDVQVDTVIAKGTAFPDLLEMVRAVLARAARG
jgi:two-component system response regulator RegA